MDEHESSSLLIGRAPAAPPGQHDSRAPDGRPDAVQPAWRQDFPIDWPQDRYVERRDFVKFLVLTSAAFAAGQVWIAGRASWRALRGLAPLTRIASVDDLAVGASLVFHYPTAGDPCILVRVAAEEFVAYDQRCTHLSCAVVPRVGDDILLCPCHHGIFDLRTGRNIAGPPPRPLPRVVLEMRGRDIYATDVEYRTV